MARPSSPRPSTALLRFFSYVGGALLCTSLVLVGVAFFGCRQLIYHPTSMSSDRRSDLATREGWEGDVLEVEAGTRIVGLVSRAVEPDAPWVLFFGGNASSLEGNQGILSIVRTATTAPLGAAVYAYRGYDGSGGEPSEEALIDDGYRLVRHLEARFGVPPARLALLGQSLGTGVAAAVAARMSGEGRPPRLVVLISPYRSIGRVFDDFVPVFPVGWAVSDRFATEDVLPAIAAPLVIIHGARDTLISVAHGRTLARLGGERVVYLECAARGHNDVWKDPAALELIADALFTPGRGRSAHEGR